MLNRLLPAEAGNAYGGLKIALWIFGAVILVKCAISFGVIFNGHSTAVTADGIPLGLYSPGAAAAVLNLFALLGLAQLVIWLIGAVVLIRYRALVPLMFAAFIFEYLCRRGISYMTPMQTTASPGADINLAILAVMLLGLALSLIPAPARANRRAVHS